MYKPRLLLPGRTRGAGVSVAVQLYAAAVLVLAFSSNLVRAIDDGDWIKCGECYFPKVTGDVNAPMLWGQVSALDPCVAVAPDGVGVMCASAMSGTLRFVFAYRLDGKGLCGYYCLPDTTSKWVITCNWDFSLGGGIDTLLSHELPDDPGPNFGGTNNFFYALIDAARNADPIVVNAATWIRDQGFPSVAIAKQGTSLYFFKWVFDSLKGSVSPNPPATTVNLPAEIRNTLGFVSNLDWEGDNISFLARVVKNESPIGTATVSSSNFAAAATQGTVVQQSGASGDTVLYSPSNSSGISGFFDNLSITRSPIVRGDPYKIEYHNPDGTLFSGNGITAHKPGYLEGTGTNTITVKCVAFYPGGSAYASLVYSLNSARTDQLNAIRNAAVLQQFYSVDAGASKIPLKWSGGTTYPSKLVIVGSGQHLNTSVNYQEIGFATVPPPIGLTYAAVSPSYPTTENSSINVTVPVWCHVVPAGCTRQVNGDLDFTVPSDLPAPTVPNTQPSTAVPFTFTTQSTGAKWFDVYPRGAGITINHSTGAISWANPTAGTQTFKIWAFSPSRIAVSNWVVNVGNGPFQITSSSTTQTAQGSSWQLLSNVIGTTWTTGPLPIGVVLDNGYIKVGTTPVGIYSINVTATAPDGTTQTQTLALTVVAPTVPTSTNPSTTTTTVNNPDGSTTTTTTVLNPNGTTTTTTTNQPAGGGTPTVSQTTTGTPGDVNSSVVDALNDLPAKLGIGEQHPLAPAESFSNQAQSLGNSEVSGLGIGITAPIIVPTPLQLNFKMPSRVGRNYEDTVPVVFAVSTAPPTVVQPFIPVIKFLVGLSATIAFWQAIASVLRYV